MLPGDSHFYRRTITTLSFNKLYLYLCISNNIDVLLLWPNNFDLDSVFPGRWFLEEQALSDSGSDLLVLNNVHSIWLLSRWLDKSRRVSAGSHGHRCGGYPWLLHLPLSVFDSFEASKSHHWSQHASPTQLKWHRAQNQLCWNHNWSHLGDNLFDKHSGVH